MVVVDNVSFFENFTYALDGSRYSRIDPVKFVENSLLKNWTDMVCLGRSYHFKYFKGCLPQILLGPFLNTLTQMDNSLPVSNIPHNAAWQFSEDPLAHIILWCSMKNVHISKMKNRNRTLQYY